MLPTFYNTGAASVASDATTVTGTGTGWGGDVLLPGDLFMDPAQPEIPPQRIASVTDGTHLELAHPWPGADMTAAAYEVRFVGNIERSTAQTRRYLEMLGQLSALGIQPNAHGEFADRAAYDIAAKGFVFLSLDGDGVTGVWTLYTKLSAAAGDWSDGQQIAGAAGPPGGAGDDGDSGWSPVFAIAVDGDRRVLELVDWTGGEGAKPATGLYVGASGLTPTIGDAVDVRGSAGSGSGDVNTSGSVTAQRLARYADGTGDVIEDAGKTVDEVLDRANHTGSQAISTVTGLQSALDGAIQSTLLTTRGDLLVRGAAAPARLSKGTQYQVLQAGATDPVYGAVNLAQAAAVTGILPAANLPDTSTTAKGVVELATAGEYRAGTDTTRALGVSEVWGGAALVALTDAATIAVDLSAGFNFGGAGNAPLALGGNRDLGAPSSVNKNQAGVLWFGASGATRTLTLNAAWKLATGVEAGPYSITTSQELGVAYVVRGSDVIVTAIVRRG